MTARILIVEDEAVLAKTLADGLRHEGFEAETASTGEDGYFRLETEPFDLLLLDWMLPGRDGLTLLAALRQKGITVPVILLTARDAVEDRVAGLEAGADDYIVKPFAFPELCARIRAQLRRHQREQLTLLGTGNLVVNLAQRSVHRAGQPIDLTPTEFDLLVYLLRHKDHVVSREMLVDAIWKDAGRTSTMNNVIDVHMSRLRKKVDLPGQPRLIHTVRGVGFRILDTP